MNAPQAAFGTSKQDIALAAVHAHPGVTPESILQYAPSLKSQQAAFDILNALERRNLIVSRPGNPFWQYYPKPAGEAAVNQAKAAIEEPDHTPALHSALVNLVLRFPGIGVLGMYEKQSVVNEQHQVSAAAKALCDSGKLERWRPDETVPFGYWIAGERPVLAAPAVAPPVAPPPKPAAAPIAPTKQDLLVAAVLKEPGLDADALFLKVPGMANVNSCAASLCALLAKKRVSRARKAGKWAYWPPGEAPADEVEVKVSKEKRMPATPAEGQRALDAGIKARAELAKAEAAVPAGGEDGSDDPTAPPPGVMEKLATLGEAMNLNAPAAPVAPVSGQPRTVAGFVIEDVPMKDHRDSAKTRVLEAMEKINVGQSFLVKDVKLRTAERVLFTGKTKLAPKKFSSEREGGLLRIGRTA